MRHQEYDLPALIEPLETRAMLSVTLNSDGSNVADPIDVIAVPPQNDSGGGDISGTVDDSGGDGTDGSGDSSGDTGTIDDGGGDTNLGDGNTGDGGDGTVNTVDDGSVTPIMYSLGGAKTPTAFTGSARHVHHARHLAHARHVHQLHLTASAKISTFSTRLIAARAQWFHS